MEPYPLVTRIVWIVTSLCNGERSKSSSTQSSLTDNNIQPCTANISSEKDSHHEEGTIYNEYNVHDFIFQTIQSIMSTFQHEHEMSIPVSNGITKQTDAFSEYLNGAWFGVDSLALLHLSEVQRVGIVLGILLSHTDTGFDTMPGHPALLALSRTREQAVSLRDTFRDTITLLKRIFQQIVISTNNNGILKESSKNTVLPDTMQVLTGQERAQLRKLSQQMQQWRCECFIGGVPIHSDRERAAEGCKIVVGTPGRVSDLISSGNLRVFSSHMLCIDSAQVIMYPDLTLHHMQVILRRLPIRRQIVAFADVDPPTASTIEPFISENIPTVYQTSLSQKFSVNSMEDTHLPVSENTQEELGTTCVTSMNQPDRENTSMTSMNNQPDRDNTSMTSMNNQSDRENTSMTSMNNQPDRDNTCMTSMKTSTFLSKSHGKVTTSIKHDQSSKSKSTTVYPPTLYQIPPENSILDYTKTNPSQLFLTFRSNPLGQLFTCPFLCILPLKMIRHHHMLSNSILGPMSHRASTNNISHSTRIDASSTAYLTLVDVIYDDSFITNTKNLRNNNQDDSNNDRATDKSSRAKRRRRTHRK